jgi:hypothetical protein
MQEESRFHPHHGSSQAGRARKALDPGYVSVDERSIKDLLAFAQEYARELKYFNDRNENEKDAKGEDESWSRFLGDDALDEIVAYLKDPEKFQDAAQKKARLARPHLILFLTFLELLQHARSQLNDLTRRHLEFYYREALRLTSRQGRSDHVHVLVELADGQEQFLLPQGTLFQAGQDALGQPLVYGSAEDLVANRARVDLTRSLFAKKQVIGLPEVRQQPDLLIELFPDDKAVREALEEGRYADRSFLAILMIALGTPDPGSALEPYPDGRRVDGKLLSELDTLLGFVPSTLYMPLSTLRALMQLRNEQARLHDKEWSKVNDYLQAAAWVRLKKPDFAITSNFDNFEKNLLAALGLTKFKGFFDGLQEVENIYDLYRRHEREDIANFIRNRLHMERVEDFADMMKIVETIHGRWRRMYEMLRSAGRKKQKEHPDHKLEPPLIRAYQADKFNDLVQRTLGTIDYSGTRAASLDDVYAQIVKLENYFHCAAEKFLFIRQVNSRQEEASPWEWQQVYAILNQAHEERLLSDRRKALQERAETKGFRDMILYALGDPDPGNALPDSQDFENLDPDQDKDYLSEKLFIEPNNFRLIRDVRGKAEKATDEEWAKVYSIFELAQRKKRLWELTPALTEKWENLYAAPDASQVQVRLKVEGEDVTPRWRTFGEGYSAVSLGKAVIVPGEIGFAIASPILGLAEGQRTITLKLVFEAKTFNLQTLGPAMRGPAPFRFLLSTEKEPLPVENPEIALLESEHALKVTLSLGLEAPAIAPPKSAQGIQTARPVLQILLADLPQDEKAVQGPLKQYRAFQGLVLEKIELKVQVDSLTQLALQNDNGLLDPKKPFEPFGLSPVAGNSLYFAHPEICSKKLDRLALTIEWLGAPDNLNAYYTGYAEPPGSEASIPSTSPVTDNTYFQASLKLYDRRLTSEKGKIQLFHAEGKDKKTGASKPRQAVIDQVGLTEREIRITTGPEVLDWCRYWQLELLPPDLLHSVYPRAAVICANKIIKEEGNIRPKPYVVNPPYTPKIKRLTAGYSSSLELDLTRGDPGQQADALYHIEPFGYCRLERASGPYHFLSQFENEGELFIGIRDLAPPQNLALLFQMAEGSADPNLEREPVHWSFLNGNRWCSLEEGRLLSDTTNGLLNSGILKLDLSPVEAGTRLPGNLYWLRATIARNSRCVGDVVAIRAQAVKATFEDQGNGSNQLAQPLSAGSITGLAEPLPEVKAIHQPFSSFGGKRPEQAGAFYTRASERLRHKNRALTSWDYEHMVLEAFPDIYKVKCLSAGVSEDPHLLDVVQVIVIPDIRGKLPFDPFEPKVPADVLLQIEQYLTKHSPPFTRLAVKNPTYIRLKVRVGVHLQRDANPGFYKNLLNEELQRYLAPWAYDRSAEIVFGGRINANLIVNFLEQRPYVDYVAGIKLFTSLDSQQFGLYEKSGKTLLEPDAILVSDRLHEIDLIAEEGYGPEFFTGINFMKIELDFEIKAE